MLVHHYLSSQIRQALQNAQTKGDLPSFDMPEVLVVDHLTSLDSAQFLPYAVEIVTRLRTHQPFQAAVNGVVLAFPGRANPAGLVMHLEDRRAVAVHLAVAPGRQAGDSGPDDNHNFSIFSPFD